MAAPGDQMRALKAELAELAHEKAEFIEGPLKAQLDHIEGRVGALGAAKAKSDIFKLSRIEALELGCACAESSSQLPRSGNAVVITIIYN